MRSMGVPLVLVSPLVLRSIALCISLTNSAMSLRAAIWRPRPGVSPICLPASEALKSSRTRTARKLISSSGVRGVLRPLRRGFLGFLRFAGTALRDADVAPAITAILSRPVLVEHLDGAGLQAMRASLQANVAFGASDDGHESILEGRGFIWWLNSRRRKQVHISPRLLLIPRRSFDPCCDGSSFLLP